MSEMSSRRKAGAGRFKHLRSERRKALRAETSTAIAKASNSELRSHAQAQARANRIDYLKRLVAEGQRGAV